MRQMADYSMNLFDLASDDLPPKMVKSIRWILYNAMPFILNIAYFGLVLSAMLLVNAKYGQGRLLALIATLMIFGSLSGQKKED
jgi:hypothetical protein